MTDKAAIKTDRQLAALKPETKHYEIKIASVRGLVVTVYPSGTKTFQFRYISPNETRRRMVLGEYPALRLAAAIDQAESLRIEVRRGSDPVGEEKLMRLRARSGETVSDLASDYFRAAEKGLHGGRNRPKRPSTLRSERTRFEKQIKPHIGSRRFSEITRSDVKQFMRTLATQGNLSPDYIASVGRTLSSIFSFAVHEERLENNPATGLTKPLETVSRERMFDEDALHKLWAALTRPLPVGLKRHPRKPSDRATGCNTDEQWPPVDPTLSLALQFALLTLTRRQDVAGASWTEIDLKSKTWTIPSARHKSRKPHVVPLTPAAIDVLQCAAKLKGHDLEGGEWPKGFIWPSRTKPDSPIAETSLTQATRRICKALDIPHGSPHDFRRSGATLLTSERGGVRRFIVSKVLSHNAQEGAAITEVYDRNDYLPEKRVALEKWQALLFEIVRGKRISTE